jgi:SAM-dependent methyltransferase
VVTPGVAAVEGVEAVGRFYDQHADAFQRVYGDVIQAFRTTDVTRLLDHEAASMELHPGMRVLDAGCGVCGPAVYFAQRYGVTVDAITASPRQARTGAARIREGGVEGLVTVRQGDFHHLAEHLPPESYDVVCFLESFGHSRDKGRALASAWEMLRRGGRLYLKDLFVREVSDPELRERIAENIRRINEAYVYDVADLYEVLRQARRLGFILSSLATVDIPLEEFEDLTISNEFQELTGINRIDDLGVYAFPVDFLEMSCLKPWYDPASGNNRYFLQNLYDLRLRGVPEHEL